MDWDELESILWNYYQSIPEPKISYESWWYGDQGIREWLLNYHLAPTTANNKASEGESK